MSGQEGGHGGGPAVPLGLGAGGGAPGRFGAREEVVHSVGVPGARGFGGPESGVHLCGLPEPDAAVVESGGADVVRAVLSRRPERVVAVARTLGEAEEVRRAIAGA
ncbi:hypothetical protein ACWC5I_42930, partial [Kitasatospora sp. NPDC001574]